MATLRIKPIIGRTVRVPRPAGGFRYGTSSSKYIYTHADSVLLIATLDTFGLDNYTPRVTVFAFFLRPSKSAPLENNGLHPSAIAR